MTEFSRFSARARCRPDACHGPRSACCNSNSSTGPDWQERGRMPSDRLRRKPAECIASSTAESVSAGRCRDYSGISRGSISDTASCLSMTVGMSLFMSASFSSCVAYRNLLRVTTNRLAYSDTRHVDYLITGFWFSGFMLCGCGLYWLVNLPSDRKRTIEKYSGILQYHACTRAYVAVSLNI